MTKEKGNFCAQVAIFTGVAFVAAYTFLYLLQDKLLYMPGTPIRHIHENPKGYLSPEERSMSYAPVMLHTSDNEEIHGWFMTENDPRNTAQLKNMRQDRRLVVFFHENAGNIGLRLDYF